MIQLQKENPLANASSGGGILKILSLDRISKGSAGPHQKAHVYSMYNNRLERD
jgi:hypothetical protein